MSKKYFPSHTFSIFAQWMSRGALGYICLQNESTHVFLLMFLISYGIGAIVQGSLSDKANSRKKIVLIAQCCLVSSCFLAYYCVLKEVESMPILALILVVNGAFGNASPALAAHMMDSGMEQKEAVIKMTIARYTGLLVGLMATILSAKLTLGLTFLMNCAALLLIHKIVIESRANKEVSS